MQFFEVYALTFDIVMRSWNCEGALLKWIKGKIPEVQFWFQENNKRDQDVYDKLMEKDELENRYGPG